MDAREGAGLRVRWKEMKVFRAMQRRAQPSSPTGLGSRLCDAPGCGRRDAAQCGYVDRRDRSCTTWWCDDHADPVGGLTFCRRHASTLRALDGSDLAHGLPELDNRAPSLVGWVGRDLDAPIREMLASLAPSAAAKVVAEPVRPVVGVTGPTRRWAKAWKTIDSLAILNRVCVEVDEANDCEVSARVDAELVGSGVPPWIERRRSGVLAPPAIAAAERGEFIAAMARSIELVMTHAEVVSAV